MSMQCTHVLAVSNVGVHRRLLSTFLCAVGPCFSPADVFPVMHHSRCFSSYAPQPMFSLLCITANVFSCYASQPMFFLLCITADVFPVMHHSRCVSCYASQPMCFLLCITADVFPVMHHSRCVSCYAPQPMCSLLCTTANVFPVMHHGFVSGSWNRAGKTPRNLETYGRHITHTLSCETGIWYCDTYLGLARGG